MTIPEAAKKYACARMKMKAWMRRNAALPETAQRKNKKHLSGALDGTMNMRWAAGVKEAKKWKSRR